MKANPLNKYQIRIARKPVLTPEMQEAVDALGAEATVEITTLTTEVENMNELLKLLQTTDAFDECEILSIILFNEYNEELLGED